MQAKLNKGGKTRLSVITVHLTFPLEHFQFRVHFLSQLIICLGTLSSKLIAASLLWTCINITYSLHGPKILRTDYLQTDKILPIDSFSELKLNLV